MKKPTPMVEIAATGRFLPEKRVTNDDLTNNKQGAFHTGNLMTGNGAIIGEFAGACHFKSDDCFLPFSG